MFYIMRTKVINSFLVSIEWRVIAFVITNIFLWVSTGDFWKATGLALVLQLVLFIVYVAWHFYRHELQKSFFAPSRALAPRPENKE